MVSNTFKSKFRLKTAQGQVALGGLCTSASQVGLGCGCDESASLERFAANPDKIFVKAFVQVGIPTRAGALVRSGGDCDENSSLESFAVAFLGAHGNVSRQQAHPRDGLAGGRERAGRIRPVATSRRGRWAATGLRAAGQGHAFLSWNSGIPGASSGDGAATCPRQTFSKSQHHSTFVQESHCTVTSQNSAGLQLMLPYDVT